MEKILLNLANWLAIEFCKKYKIDCSGSHIYKYPRKFWYALCSDKTGRAIVTVQFHKNQVPTYTFNKEDFNN